jgi:hypothetical protein
VIKATQPHPRLPACELFEPRYPRRHGPGRLQVSALPNPRDGLIDAAGVPLRFVMRCCVYCLYSLTQTLRQDGCTDIKVTAPESPNLAPWWGGS